MQTLLGSWIFILLQSKIGSVRCAIYPSGSTRANQSTNTLLWNVVLVVRIGHQIWFLFLYDRPCHMKVHYDKDQRFWQLRLLTVKWRAGSPSRVPRC